MLNRRRLSPLFLAAGLIAWGFLSAPLPAQDGNDPRPAIAVVDFAAEGAAKPETGRTVAERLFSYIGAGEGYRLVNRSRVDAILKEQNFQLSDLVSDKKRAAEFGEMLGARYVVTGVVIVDEFFGDVHIAAQLTDATTAEALATPFVEAPDARGILDKLPGLASALVGRVSPEAAPGPAPAIPPKDRALIVARSGAPYSSIQAALNAARSGETVLVRSGTYEGRLTFKEGVRLRAEDGARVVVKWTGAGPGLTAENCASGSIENIAFDGASGPALRVEDFGERSDAELLEILRPRPCVALLDSSLQILNCSFEGANAGVLAWGSRAAPRISGCEARGMMAGFVFGGGAKGTAEGNLCEGNEEAGLWVYGAGTAPSLSGNRCFRNKRHGIEFGGGAAGEAVANLCEDNFQSGVASVHSSTAPVLRRNECRRNGFHGIAFEDASGFAGANICENNGQAGINVFGETAGPDLRDNVLRGNGSWRVVFHGGARGESVDSDGVRSWLP